MVLYSLNQQLFGSNNDHNRLMIAESIYFILVAGNMTYIQGVFTECSGELEVNNTCTGVFCSISSNWTLLLIFNNFIFTCKYTYRNNCHESG